MLHWGFADTAAPPELPDRVLPAAWPSSPDGSKLYLGYNKFYERTYDNRFYLDYGRPPNVRPETATAGEFRVLDTQTWRKIATIKTSTSFWSAVTANNGSILYAMVPHKHSILVILTLPRPCAKLARSTSAVCQPSPWSRPNNPSHGNSLVILQYK